MAQSCPWRRCQQFHTPNTVLKLTTVVTAVHSWSLNLCFSCYIHLYVMSLFRYGKARRCVTVWYPCSMFLPGVLLFIKAILCHKHHLFAFLFFCLSYPLFLTARDLTACKTAFSMHAHKYAHKEIWCSIILKTHNFSLTIHRIFSYCFSYLNNKAETVSLITMQWGNCWTREANIWHGDYTGPKECLKLKIIFLP